MVVTSISENYAFYIIKTEAEALSFPKYSQSCPRLYSVIIQNVVNLRFFTTANISKFRRELSSLSHFAASSGYVTLDGWMAFLVYNFSTSTTASLSIMLRQGQEFMGQ